MTHEEAVGFLQASGWLQDHDKQIYEQGKRDGIEERKTGKWFVLHDEYGDVVEAVCSLCEMNGNHTWRYCPHCGAKMEGAEE